MKKSPIKVNDKIYFQEEKLPYEVKAVNKQFVFCSRKFDKKEDDVILIHKVEMQAYMSKAEAYKDLKNEIVYTIIDLEKNIRSTTDLVFNVYDFQNQQNIETCLNDLVIGDIGLSRRNELQITHYSIERPKS